MLQNAPVHWFAHPLSHIPVNLLHGAPFLQWPGQSMHNLFDMYLLPVHTIQSIVSAFGSEHPCIQDPLKASQPPVQLEEQSLVHPFEYLPESQPTKLPTEFGPVVLHSI